MRRAGERRRHHRLAAGVEQLRHRPEALRQRRRRILLGLGRGALGRVGRWFVGAIRNKLDRGWLDRGWLGRRRYGRPGAWCSHRFGGGCHGRRSEEHTSELQSLMRISYAVFCLKKKKKKVQKQHTNLSKSTNSNEAMTNK